MGALGSCRSVGRRRPGSRVPWPGLSNRFAGTVPDLAWAEGANTIQFLVGRIELERISADDFDKAIYERFRQGRHAAQYFDPSKAEKTEPDAGRALSTATRALSQTRAVIDGGAVGPYLTRVRSRSIGTSGREVTVWWKGPSSLTVRRPSCPVNRVVHDPNR